MKRKARSVILNVVLALALLGLGLWLGQVLRLVPNLSRESPQDTATAEQDAHESAAVSCAPGTRPEMLSAAYWIRDGAQMELFTAGEIAEFNRNNPLFVNYNSIEEGFKRKLFMYDLPDSLSGEIVTDLVNPTQIEQFSSASDPTYINGAIPAEDYWTALEQSLALDRIPESVTPLYAICIRQQVGKLFPTDDFAAADPDELYFNDFISAEVMPFTGVVILHESADGEWSYVLNGSFCCWVRQDALAVCADREEWLEACRPERFVLVTGNKLVLDETAAPTSSSGMILPMGTKLRLSDDPPERVNDRSVWGCYCVEIPCCGSDGLLSWEQALVPITEDVHEGYLTMTSASVLEQAFKMLGHVYGYGGSLSSNDCSGVVRQIYGCYGFELPRNARAIAILSDLGSFGSGEMTAAKKLAYMDDMPAGILFFMNGHLMIYLGKDAGKPYVLSSCASCILPGHELSDVCETNCVFVSDMDLLRKSGKTWLEDISFILWKTF